MKPPCPTEHEEACVLADWLTHRGLVFAHVPNEARRSFSLAARLKREGMSAGVPDYLIFSPSSSSDARGFAIELKRRTGGRVTPAQRGWLEDLRACGWECKVARGADEAIQWLTERGL